MNRLILLVLIGLFSCKKQEDITVKSSIPVRIYISGKDAAYGYIHLVKKNGLNYSLYEFPKDYLKLDTTILFDVGDYIKVHIYYNESVENIQYGNTCQFYQGGLKKEDLNRFGELNTGYISQ